MTLLELKIKINELLERHSELANLSVVNEDDYSVYEYSGDFEVMYQAKNKNDFWHLYTEAYIKENGKDFSKIEKVILFS